MQTGFSNLAGGRSMHRRSLWQIIKPNLKVFDGTLALIVIQILSVSLDTVYSAGIEFPGRNEDHQRIFLVAVVMMWIAAIIPPQTLMRFAVPIYSVGVALLVAGAMFGLIKKGARRWLNVGVVIQPSEIMKIAMPLMLAWFFQKREGNIGWREFVVAALLLIVPVGLIMRQPDLGTALLVMAVGFYVIFLAGLTWKVLAALFVAGAASLPLVWTLMHDYQRHRIMTLIDPTTAPLGKNFHIKQTKNANGTGNKNDKDRHKDTQSHQEFIPERTTDFIFAVYSEEFGLIGNAVLLVLYLLLIGRGMIIAANAPTFFTRLLAGAVTLMFFTYAFVN